MADQNINLILDVEGGQVVDRLRESLAQAYSQMGELAASFARGEIAVTEFDSECKQLTQTQLQLARALNEVEKAGGGGKGSGRASGAGYAILELSRGLEDLQYGIAGVLNNIPNLAIDLGRVAGVSTGAAAAIGGAVSLLAVGLYQLYKNWDQVKALIEGTSFEEVKTQLDVLRDRVEEIGKKKTKVAFDYVELADAKKVIDDINQGLKLTEELRRTQAHYEAEAGRRIREAIVEAPEGGAAIEARQRAVVVEDETRRIDAEFKKRRAAVEADVAEQERIMRSDNAMADDVEAANSRRIVLERQLEDIDRRHLQAVEAARIPGGAADIRFAEITRGAIQGTGAEQARRREQLIDISRRAGLGGVAGAIEAATPEHVMAEERADSEFEQAIKDRIDQVKKRDERAKRRARIRRDADEFDMQANRDFRAVTKREKDEEARAFDVQASLDYASIAGESNRIRQAVGKTWQAQYEASTAANRAALEAGAQVARTPGEERALAAVGQPYAIPPEVLERRMQAQMEARLLQRGATPEGAQVAAEEIRQAGQQDITRRLTNMSSLGLNTQAQTLRLTQELGAEIAQISGFQQMLAREVSDQRQLAAQRRANTRSAMRTRVPGGG